jgi:hypothetical protein
MKARWWLLTLGLLWWSTPILAQPVFDVACSGFGNAVNTITTGTCSASGSNRLAHLCGAWGNVTTEQDTDASYGGVSATFVTRVQTGSLGVAVYRLIAPSTGSQTATMNFDGFVRGTFGAMTFTNAHQTIPLGTAVTASGSSTTATVNVTSAANELVAGCVLITDPLNPVPGAGQSPAKWDETTTSAGLDFYGAGSTETGAGTTTVSWTQDNSNEWGIIGVGVKPIAVAAGRRRVINVYP